MIRTNVVQQFGSRVCQSEAPINMLGSLDTKITEWQPQATALNTYYFMFSHHSSDGGGITTPSYI